MDGEPVPFGFDVCHSPATTIETHPGAMWQDEEAWQVCLPHQCDQWMITDARTKEQALKDLDQFIAEAQAARRKLEAL
jgi:hypothetical protein